MYSPQIEYTQVHKLYQLKSVMCAAGEHIAMTDLVKEALSEYLPKKSKEVKKRYGEWNLIKERAKE